MAQIDVYAWGRGDCGQLGLAEASETATALPQILETLRGKDIVALAAGSFHTTGITSDGELYAWGANDEGQCSRKEPGVEQVVTPTRIEVLENFKIGVAACGANHTIAVSDDGGVFGFGAADFGQLGVGQVNSSKIIHPKACKALKEAGRIARAAAGGNHTLFLEISGTVYVTGDASFGALGLGSDDSTGNGNKRGRDGDYVATTGNVDNNRGGGGGGVQSIFHPLELYRLWPVGVCQIAAGDAHSAALTVDGTVFTWGRGKSGALGIGHFQNSSEPTLIRALSGMFIKQITCGSDHTVALTQEGRVYACGAGKYGATGLGHNNSVCSPQRMAGLEEESMAAAVATVVQVSAGGRHTLLLTEGNEVWATGSNQHGQCGQPKDQIRSKDVQNNKREDERMEEEEEDQVVLVPRPLAGLPPSSLVLFVASGGDHSFAVVQSSSSSPSSFGQENEDIIPIKEAAVAATEQMLLPGPRLDRSHGNSWLPSTPAPLLPLVRAAISNDAAASDAIKALKSCLQATFSNPSYLINAFRTTSSHLATEAAPPSQQRLGVPNLDLPAISEMYQGVLKLYDQGIVTVLGSASIKLLEKIERYLSQQYAAASDRAGTTKSFSSDPNLDLEISLIPELSWVPPTLFILLQNPLASDPATYGSQIILRLGRILSTSLPAAQRIPVRRALQNLLGQLPAEAFAARCVRPVQKYLTHLVTSGRLGAGRLEAMMAGVLIDVLRQANDDTGGKINASEFYNKSLSKALDLGAEYLAWVKHRETSPNALVSFCQMPFLLVPEAKARILNGEAMLQKQQHMSAAAMQAFITGQNPAEVGYLRLSIRRTHVVEDALTALVLHSQDLKKPLKATFISGGVPEPAQDEGGVRKEFFQLLTRDLFRPDFGMFTYDESTRLYWFNIAAANSILHTAMDVEEEEENKVFEEMQVESEREYTMVGALMGLAIYNAVLLDVHFPVVLYKKLLGQTPDFTDLKLAFPELGRGLQALLDYEPASEVEDIFCRHFDAEFEAFGEIKHQELIPGGKDIPVTGENRLEYVQAYAKWVLEDSISRQFKAFAKGFHTVAGGPALSLFTPAELELLVCGLPHLDFEGLQNAAKYEGGYSADSTAVKWFWEVVRGTFTLEQKRQFLMFTTGSDRAPVGGLSTLSICIQRAGPDTERLPTSHTCFDTLLLPEYSSKEKMRERLLTAITNAQGFGLQ